MIDGMWMWGALGLVLLAVEMATGTFYVLWFGVAALCTAIAVWMFPSMPHAIQFVIFAVLAVGSLLIWKLNYKKTETHSRVGQAQGEEIGRVGTITQTCSANLVGKIRFTQGVLGAKEWAAVSTETIEVGQSAKVTAVEGNILRVSTHFN